MWKHLKTYKWNFVENALFLPPSFTWQYIFQYRILFMPKHNWVRTLTFKKNVWPNLQRIVLQKAIFDFYSNAGVLQASFLPQQSF